MNALRSIARTVALALGPDTEVRFSMQEGAASRPFASVTQATALQSSPRGAAHVDLSQTFAVACWPTEGLNVESSRVEAERVAGQLREALTIGIDPALYRASSGRRHPMRIALYDYSSIGLYEGVGDAQRLGVMRVAGDPSFSVIEEDGLFAITATVRVMWSEPITVPSTAPLVGSVSATPGP